MKDFKQYLSNHSNNLTATYLGCIKPFLEWLSVFNLQAKELRLSHFQGYVSHLHEEGLQANKIRLTIAALRNYGYMLVLNGKASEQLAMELYIKGIHQTPFPALFQWDELEHIYQRFSTPGITGQRNKTILSLLIYQALTPDEIANLCPGHVDLEKKAITIPDSYRGKGRVLRLEGDQLPLLQTYISELRPRLLSIAGTDNACLFISTSEQQQGRHITDNLRNTLQRRYPQIRSYTQLRASVLHHWYTLYGLERTIQMAGHHYIPQSPAKR